MNVCAQWVAVLVKGNEATSAQAHLTVYVILECGARLHV